MTRTAVVVLVDDADVLVELVRIGCAAVAAQSIATTDAVRSMRRARTLRVGAQFIDELDPTDDT